MDAPKYKQGKIEQAYESNLNTITSYNVSFKQALVGLKLSEEISIECRKKYHLEFNS